jgi:hypothetical protein
LTGIKILLNNKQISIVEKNRQKSGDNPPNPAYIDPTINLPKSEGIIRGIGEKLEANPVTGTMNVPIATSPGHSGFGLQLSFSYDSGSGNGSYGLGWRLPIPAITHKTDKGLPKYQNTDESDVFILFGAEDLVPELIEKNGKIDMEISQFTLSPSVEQVLKTVGPENLISAADFCQVIFKLHPEYAGGIARTLKLEATPNKQTASKWIEEVQTLLDLGRYQELLNSKETSKYISNLPPEKELKDKPTLHGRLLVIGLSLLEPALYQQLEHVEAFNTLLKELREPLDDILSERGQMLYDQVLKPAPVIPEEFDSVKNWSDDELRNSKEDLLGRAAFARFLSKRISSIPLEGAYAMHLYGPWGSGKSTVLNFIEAELGNEWSVVDFNAWRHQYIDPPWWSLMESVFQVTKKKLSLWNRIKEYYWRFSSSTIIYILAFIVMAALVVLLWPWLTAIITLPTTGQPKPVSDLLSALGSAAKDVTEILALIGIAWGGILTVNRSLLLSSAKSAQDYKDRSRDAMNEIKKHFGELINRLLPRRVAIFIDDLDRCRSSYVVELLEGIQTLFREAPVVFIVAADRSWLNACYEQEYDKFKPQVGEPGKPLGTLFLEKAFRFSTPLPGIPDELKKQYWQYLLQIKSALQQADLDKARREAQEKISQSRSEAEVQKVVDSSDELPFEEKRAIREAAVERLATPEIIERLEHTLKPYASLLEQNPREMKRLVNTYSANRALAFLSEVNIERHQLVLWTILSSRWPQLAEYLEEKPEMLEKIRKQDLADVHDENFKKLLEEPVVRDVINGVKDKDMPSHIPLEIATIKKSAQMRA